MRKLVVSTLLALGGGAVFVLGSPYYRVFPTNNNPAYLAGLAVGLLAAALAFRRIGALKVYWRPAYALFCAAAATLFLSTGVLNLHQRGMPGLQFLALDKLSQFLHVVPVLLVLTLLAGGNLKSVFIQAGHLQRGLRFGLISFAGFAVLALIFGLGSSGFSASLGGAALWILLFVFANAVMEELWFRGIFLGPYEAAVGRIPAILVTSAVFGASHINATYDFLGEGIVFGLVVFGLGAVGAYAMRRDDSLIGPVLFHAGYDLLVILPALETL